MVGDGHRQTAVTSTHAENRWSRKFVILASQAENASSILVARSNIELVTALPPRSTVDLPPAGPDVHADPYFGARPSRGLLLL